jgi:hypothetical protein
MASSRKRYDCPVAYHVSTNSIGVYVSNKYTALLIYDLWLSDAIEQRKTDVLSLFSILPPTPWPTWSRQHIISLLNNCWHKRVLAKHTITDGDVIKATDYRRNNYKPDNYERLVITAHTKLTEQESIALNNTMMYPQVLNHVLRSPSPMAAKIALEIDCMSFFPDGTSATRHIKPVWNFLRAKYGKRWS